MFGWLRNKPDENVEMNGWTAEVDISYNMQSASLFARKIWEALYEAYLYCGDPKSWDSFLCDLRSWESMIESKWKAGEDFVKFHWHVRGPYTENSWEDVYGRGDDVFEIIVDTQVVGDKKILIKKRHCQIVP